MEFNRHNYDSKLETLLNKLSTELQQNLDTPEWVGTLTSFDIIPSNGNLYPIELNTNIYFILDSLNYIDLQPLAVYLNENGYKRCILRLHCNTQEWNCDENADVIEVIEKLFGNYNIELKIVYQSNEILDYTRELETDFILQQRWNRNFIDVLASNKENFNQFLKENNLYNFEEIQNLNIDNYDYNLEAPSFFYKDPLLDVGKGTHPVIVDKNVNIVDTPIQVGVQPDTYANCRVEIVKKLVIGKNFSIDVSTHNNDYFILPKFVKTEPYPTDYRTTSGEVLYSNFKKSINTHLISPPNLLENSLIEMKDGTFKEINKVEKGDIVRFYKFKEFTKLYNEYFLNDDGTYYESYKTSFTWESQVEPILGNSYKDLTLYKPVELEIKGIKTGRCYKKVNINNTLSLIKNRHLVYFTDEFNYFRHNYTNSLVLGGKLLNLDGTDFTVNTYVEETGNFNTYGLIINEYDLFVPYFVNLNGTLVLTY